MIFKRILLYSTLALVLAAGFFFRGDLERYFLLSSQKLAELVTDGFGGLAENVEKDISAPPPLRADRETRGASLTSAGVVKFTNTERQKAGRTALKQNNKLAQAARAKAEDILAKQYFAHVSPSGAGPDKLADNANYDYLTIGENLALGNFAGDQDLVDAWMGSTGHRENILAKKFTEIGVAVLTGTYEGKTTWVAVQEFGAPASVCPAVDAKTLDLIEGNKNELGVISAKLESRKTDLRAALLDAEYAKMVEEYNALVKKHNDLVSATKDLIDKYNQEVKIRNTCLENFTAG